MLNKKDVDKIDFYIGTGGGSGEAALDIATFLREHFKEVNFVVSGEAKSAGTLLVLSGDDIFMTETGSLGPIDAQVLIGRSVVSAADYVDWYEKKREEAKNEGLNPIDIIMMAQISGGELYKVYNDLNFARDFVIKWLPKYKLKDWKHPNNPEISVNSQDKEKEAGKIVDKLLDREKWRTHGRSLKLPI